MGKKKNKHGKHGHHRDGSGGEAGMHGPIPAPLAGFAAMVTREVTKQLQSPTTRAAMATGLRAAADALTKASAPTPPPVPPVPPQPAAAPVPPVPPVPPQAPGDAPQGTTRAPDTQAIAGAIEDAAKLVLGRLFGGKV